MTEANGLPVVREPELVGVAEIADMLGVSKARVHQLLDSYTDFPLPAAELSAGRIWTRPSVETWIALHPERTPGRPKAETSSAADTARPEVLDDVLRLALQRRASDVHLEPSSDGVRVRCRIDSVLHEVETLPADSFPELVTRLKVLMKGNPNERVLPQDGRLDGDIDGTAFTVRVSISPGVFGEHVVIRVLDRVATLRPLSDVGFDEADLRRYRTRIGASDGLIVVTGPTGAGKSMTLYATLADVADPERKTVTIEDPVEYRLRGLQQIQINPRAGLTMTTAIRAVLRSDPDVLMVGELRDLLSANICVEAALTGHLVLTALHAPDASTALRRLVAMGVEPFLVAGATRCVVAQRLLRRLCGNCAEQWHPTDADLAEHGLDAAAAKRLGAIRRPRGCGECRETGYAGRTGVFEVLIVDDDIERLLVHSATAAQIRDAARDAGTTSLFGRAIDKVAAGETSLEEVFRVLRGPDEGARARMVAQR